MVFAQPVPVRLPGQKQAMPSIRVVEKISEKKFKIRVGKKTIIIDPKDALGIYSKVQELGYGSLSTKISSMIRQKATAFKTPEKKSIPKKTTPKPKPKAKPVEKPRKKKKEPKVKVKPKPKELVEKPKLKEPKLALGEISLDVLGVSKTIPKPIPEIERRVEKAVEEPSAEVKPLIRRRLDLDEINTIQINFEKSEQRKVFVSFEIDDSVFEKDYKGKRKLSFKLPLRFLLEENEPKFRSFLATSIEEHIPNFILTEKAAKKIITQTRESFRATLGREMHSLRFDFNKKTEVISLKGFPLTHIIVPLTTQVSIDELNGKKDLIEKILKPYEQYAQPVLFNRVAERLWGEIKSKKMEPEEIQEPKTRKLIDF